MPVYMVRLVVISMQMEELENVLLCVIVEHMLLQREQVIIAVNI